MVGRPASRVQECPRGGQEWSTAEEGDGEGDRQRSFRQKGREDN